MLLKSSNTMLALYFLVSAVTGQVGECDPSDNMPDYGLNPMCNFAGKCDMSRGVGKCYCCGIDEKTLEPELINGVPDCPNWNYGDYRTARQDPAGPCMEHRQYVAVSWRYYFPPSSSFKCDQTDNLAKLLEEVKTFYNTHGYTGRIVEDTVNTPHCRECTPNAVCEYKPLVGSTAVKHTVGIEINYGTDFHTFYDDGCFVETDPIPDQFKDRCFANQDDGHLAFLTFGRAREYNPAEPTAWNAPATADFLHLNDKLGLGITESNFLDVINIRKDSTRTYEPTSNPTEQPTADPTTAEPTAQPTADPTTPNPTPMPSADPTTAEPTPTPTTADNCFKLGVTNKLEDVKYMGNGVACRGGIKSEWPGGKTCKSPYIVCLPEENTPNQYPKNPFFDNTHQYTVQQCLYECAWDQRCRGFEFNAKNGGATGECVLIDDLPLEIEDPGSYVYDAEDQDLEQYGSLCFQKQDYCNPFFRADQLTQDMLECYCPNNRKGFYTKKVKRVVENYKFCENDAEVDERIKQAGANRMFHLCENWCLFNTFTPEQESWYWNPWKKCWREQYAGVGAHRSYCNRVIRNPDTIEQYFINYRTNNFCPPFTGAPTELPAGGPFTWFLAQEEQNCDDACESRSMKCDDTATADLAEPTPAPTVDVAFAQAGVTCNSHGVAPAHWAAPVLKTMNNECLVRSARTEENTGCQWATGVGYQRLCACAPNSED